MLKNMALAVIAAAMISGCSEREPSPAIAGAAIGSGGASMAMPIPKFNALLVSDQAAYKVAASPAADANLNAILASLPKPKGEDETSDAGDASEESADGEPAAKGAAGSILSGLKNLLPGGKKSGKAESDDEDTAASKDVTEMLRDDARPEVTEVPKNPADRPSQGIELARKAAAMSAMQALMLMAMQLPMDDGDGTLLGAAIVKDVGNPGAMSAENLNPKGIRIVAMKWLDADTLEVEAEISIGDLADTVTKIAPKLNMDSIRTLGEDKCLAAKGKGMIPPGMRTANKATPGQRARDAADGGF